MAVTYVGASNAAGQSAGTTTTATTVSITPTLPASTADGDRVFVVQCASNTSATTPANWTVVGTKDTVVGSGTVAAGSGLRYMTVYYRDYDGSWTAMPAFTLTSAAQNSHWIGAVSVRPTDSSSYRWDTPTITTVGGSFNTAGTSYTDSSAASFTTTSGGFLIIGTCFNDNVTSSAAALTQTGATFGTVTERCDGGTATGNDVSGKLHTTTVTTGASATTTHTQTISAASQGETLIVQQTESAVPWPYLVEIDMLAWGSNQTTSNIPAPTTAVTDDIILCILNTYINTPTITTVPSGFTLATAAPAVEPYASGEQRTYVYWKRCDGTGEPATYNFVHGTAHRSGWSVVYRGCITSGDPIDAAATATTEAAVAAFPDISVTTTVDNCTLVWTNANGEGDNTLNPAGTIMRGCDPAQGQGFAIADKGQAVAGGSGTLAGQLEFGSSALPKTVWLGALKPPGGTPDTTKFFVML